MNTDVAGRVKNVQLPVSRPLLPLFEAIANSFHAIEDASESNGKIEIEVVRDPDVLLADSDKGLADIVGFIVRDNGIGFDEENFEAFSTSDTTYKASRGGKGIGRFSWLAAFDSVEIDSIFRKNGNSMRRRFAFKPIGSGIENPTCIKHSENSRETAIHLSGFKDKYRKPCPKGLETIAVFIVEEFLEYFIGASCPLITLKDNSNRIDLNDFFEKQMKIKSDRVDIKIKGKRFGVLHVRLYSSHINEHLLHLCAHARVVTKEKLAGRIPNLARKLADPDGKEFVYAGYVDSEVLDANVSPDRTSFNLPKREDNFLPGEISSNDIGEGVLQETGRFLAPYTAPVAAKKRERVEQFVNSEGAMYRPILKHLGKKIDQIEPEANNDEIDRKLYEAYHDLQEELREEGQKLMAAPAPKEMDFEDFKQRFDGYFEKISEVNQADLARYVCHRRAILDFFKKQLELQDDGKYSREERIHSIIFPRGKTSSEVLAKDHNLWLVDERFSFHVFLGSDQSISKAAPLTSSSKKEPDILVFDKACAFSDKSGVPFTSITILEFKKPQRSDYSEKENPFTQIAGYIEEIRTGKANDKDGRPMPIPENLPFYCYVVCDLTPNLKKWAHLSELQETPDKLGFFGYKRHYNAYWEVISYSKLMADAEKRNQAFFQKLGLP